MDSQGVLKLQENTLVGLWKKPESILMTAVPQATSTSCRLLAASSVAKNPSPPPPQRGGILGGERQTRDKAAGAARRWPLYLPYAEEELHGHTPWKVSPRGVGCVAGGEKDLGRRVCSWSHCRSTLSSQQVRGSPRAYVLTRETLPPESMNVDLSGSCFERKQCAGNSRAQTGAVPAHSGGPRQGRQGPSPPSPRKETQHAGQHPAVVV